MRTWMYAALAVAVTLGAAPSSASATPTAKGPSLTELKAGGPLGLGVVGGTTNGVTLKVWPVRTHGIVLHLGAAPVLNSMSVHLSYRLHTPAIVAPDGGPALHFQFGPAFRTRLVFQATGVFAELGGGVVAGMSVTVPRWPVEFFAEVQPTFAGSVSKPGTGLGLGVEGVGGVRIFLGGAKKPAQDETVWGTPTPEPPPEPAPADEDPDDKGAPGPEGTP
jgi:hypothetical protein